MNTCHSCKHLILLVTLSLASSAQADLCNDLSALTKFAQHSEGDASTMTVDYLSADSKCSTSFGLSGTRSIHCAKGFDYRSDVATAVFEKLVTGTKACVDSVTQSVDDQDVNHPDFYDLRSFETKDSTISISLKDKGALQMTYVFLRVEARK